MQAEKNDLDNAKQLLAAGSHACVAVNAQKNAAADGHGIKPLLQLLREQADLLCGAAVADRVIGKAAALLLAYGGVHRLWADLLSEEAIPVLTHYGIAFDCGLRTPCIQNRDGTAPCPMELRARELQTPQQAWEVFNGLLA